MRLLSTILLASFFFSAVSFSALGNDYPKLDKERKFIQLAVGLKTKSTLLFRGATYYGGPQITPVFFLGLWNDHIHFFGNSLEYRRFYWGKKLRGKNRIIMLSDDPLFITNEPKGLRNSRDSTWEFQNTLEFFYPNYYHTLAELDLMYAKDISKSKGDYLETSLKITLINIGEGIKNLSLFRPKAVLTMGYGGARHNAFQYGNTSNKAGATHLEIGIEVESPGRLDPAYPTMKAFYYTLLGKDNKNGALVSDNTHGFYIEGTFAYGIF